MASPTTDTSVKANGAASEFKNKILDSEQHLEHMAKNAGHKIGAMASDFASTTSDSLAASRDYVKANPVKGVALAATAGIVVGSLLTMAMRSPRP
jgi:ElaB/YqjD/DUF883 family membrane-anchored ribosome-binding protein